MLSVSAPRRTSKARRKRAGIACPIAMTTAVSQVVIEAHIFGASHIDRLFPVEPIYPHVGVAYVATEKLGENVGRRNAS